VFEVLLQREKLGTTAVGYGVAIPHGKLPKLEKLFGFFARLSARSISRQWTASRST
jgi:PTS system nitrogen regulatory IIA component